MSENLQILGIETSCDETAAAIVAGSVTGDGFVEQAAILSNVVLSQQDHAAFGGVVPELAARAHVEALDDVVLAALERADISFSDLDGVAVTAGPGLVGGLIVGLMAAKALSLAHDLPMIGVNHLEGHALTARLSDRITYPYLLLLVSGGHSQILAVEGLDRYRRLGTTIDDALGEAFDKTAKLLGLGYPGGPAVERTAADGDPHRFRFPMPLKGTSQPNFSFSGLKTAVRQQAEAIAAETGLRDQDIADICASFQNTIANIVEERLRKAYSLAQAELGISEPLPLAVAGGVAANLVLRARLEHVAAELGSHLTAAPLPLCGDNGAMIAWAGLEHLAQACLAGQPWKSDLALAPRARWPLDEEAAPLVGHGRAGTKV